MAEAETASGFDPQHTALLVADIQPDFLPGGALGIKNGDRLLAPLADLMRSGLFAHQVATQDWHPPGHISFASRHGREPLDTIDLYGHVQELWPDHCVQGSRGAELARGLPWERVDIILRKGNNPDVDSYSAFRNNWDANGERPSTGLAGYLRDRGVDTVVVCGLARDFCVRWSAEDAADAGFDTYVVWDLTQPINWCNDRAIVELLEARGIHLVELADLTA